MNTNKRMRDDWRKPPGCDDIRGDFATTFERLQMALDDIDELERDIALLNEYATPEAYLR